MFEATKSKKLASVLATSASVTGDSKEAPELVLDRVSCIHHLVQFRSDKGATARARIDSGSKVNAITPAYATKLGLTVQKTDVGAQKINELSLATYRMVIAAFQVPYKLGRARFLQESFLVANTIMEVVL